MVRSIRSFRTVSLAVAFVLVVSATGLASAQQMYHSARQATAQPTMEGTPIDPEAVVKLDMGKAQTTPLSDDVPHRYFSFNGTANKLVVITVQKLTGNLAFDVAVDTQSGDEIGRASGTFVETIALTIKLPQDGKYSVYVKSLNPGAGDFEAGTASVMVGDAPLAAK